MLEKVGVPGTMHGAKMALAFEAASYTWYVRTFKCVDDRFHGTNRALGRLHRTAHGAVKGLKGVEEALKRQDMHQLGYDRSWPKGRDGR